MTSHQVENYNPIYQIQIEATSIFEYKRVDNIEKLFNPFNNLLLAGDAFKPTDTDWLGIIT